MNKIFAFFIFFVIFSFSGNTQTWQWLKSSTTSSSANITDGAANCVDASGNVFITGNYVPPVAFGTYTLNGNTTATNIYLAKYDGNGNVLWAKTSSGGNTDNVYSVITDASGNSYITGTYQGPNIIFDTHTLTSSGSGNAFLVKYDPNGSVLWAKSSNGAAEGKSVGTDAAGNVYQTGTFNFSVIFDTYTLTSPGSNIYLIKYDAGGNIVWTKNSVSNDLFNNQSNAICTDASGNCVITGNHSSGILSFGSNSITTNHRQNIFTVKYDASGNALWAQTVGGNGADISRAVSTDTNNNSYITGNYSSSPFVFGSSTLTTASGDIFTAKYDANGNPLWAVSATGTAITGYCVSSYAYGLFITGSMDAAGSPITIGSYTLSPPAGYSDPSYLIQLDPNGNLVSANSFVSGGDDWIGICTDQNCNAYLTGDFGTGTFSLGTNSATLTGSEDAFVAKLTYTCPNFTGIKQVQIQNYFSVYPNPNNGSFTVQSDKQIVNGELVIMNTLGQTIFTQFIHKGTNIINTFNLAKGIYYYSLKENKVDFGSGKLLIE